MMLFKAKLGLLGGDKESGMLTNAMSLTSSTELYSQWVLTSWYTLIHTAPIYMLLVLLGTR